MTNRFSIQILHILLLSDGVSIPSETKFFEGCVELMALGDPRKSFQTSLDGNNVVFACPTV